MLVDTLPQLKPESRWRRIWRWPHLGLLAILVVTLGFHFAAIDRPPTIVWDEVWYVGDARSIISGTGELRPEHPPLAKLFIVAGDYIFHGFSTPEKETGARTIQSLGGNQDKDTTIYIRGSLNLKAGSTIRIDAEQMEITGLDPLNNQITVKRGAGGSTVSEHSALRDITVYTDNAWGWRFFAIIFGEIGIVFFYLICRRLDFSLKATLAATLLLAFDMMTFLHSGLALLDVYMVTFMLGAILFYLRENYPLSGLFLALSSLCKLTVVLVVIALILHWLIYRRDRWQWAVGGLIVAAVSFVVLLVAFDLFIHRGFENPVARIQSLLSSTAANQFTVPKLSISSRPWTWIYPQWVQVYDNSPNQPFLIYSYNPQYVSFISSTIQILIVPVIGYMVYKAIKGSVPAGLVFLWFVASYLVWIPLDIVTNRVTFVFYFLTTTPAICLALGMAISDILDKLKARRQRVGRLTNGVKAGYAGVALYLLLHLAIFVVFNPAIPPLIKTWLPPFYNG